MCIVFTYGNTYFKILLQCVFLVVFLHVLCSIVLVFCCIETSFGQTRLSVMNSSQETFYPVVVIGKDKYFCCTALFNTVTKTLSLHIVVS